ncbi:MAG: cohesin domain-containing protein [Candidatus Bathyarchaeota archaeon]|nr:cohesin domain-containing protein [Candidatus Bathyarchaeota archaeon]
MNSSVFQNGKKSKRRFNIEFFFLIVFFLLLAVLISLLTVLITSVSEVADTTPPAIAIISPQNTTYKTSSVPLVFTVNEPTCWMGYSLNNQANVTISANCSLTGLYNGCHSVSVCGNDSCGNTGASEKVYFTVAVNHPPTAPVVDVLPEFPVTADELICKIVIPSVDPDGDPITYTYEWYKNDAIQTDLTTNTVSFSKTSKGETWKCVVTPTDETKNGPTDEDSATIMNNPPAASNVRITPSSPFTDDDLTGSYSFSDADEDEESGTEIRWHKDGVLQAVYNNVLTIPSEATSEGEEWYLTVKPKDGTDFGNLAKSNAVSIQKTPAYTLRVYSSPSEVTFIVDGETHTTPWTGTYGQDASLSLEMPSTHTVAEAKYFWSNWTDGETSRSRAVTLNRNISLTGQFSGPYYELTVNSSPITGITFSVNGVDETTPHTEWLPEGSYTLVMPETYDKYVWSHWLEDGDTDRTKTITLPGTTWTAVYRQDTIPPSVTIISPQNTTYATSSVPLTFFVNASTSWIGYSLDNEANVTIAGNTTLTSLSDGCHNVVVYANDTFGNMGNSGKIYFTVDTTPPHITIMSPENKTYATSSVSLTFMVSEPTSWTGYSLDNQANVTITGNTTLTGLVNSGHSVMIYGSDNLGNMGASEKVYFTVAVNRPPTTPVVKVTPAAAYTVDDLLCTITSESSDPDGDSVTYTYEWFRDEELQQTNSTTELTNVLSSTKTAKGEVWMCVVTPNDGQIDGPSDEDQVTIQNSPPEAQNLTILPAAPDTTFSLNASYNYVDADDDPESGTEIRWYKDGVLQSAYNDLETVPSNATCRGEEWYFTVRPKDGVDFGDLKTSPSVIIQNAPPSKPMVEIHPDSPKTTDDLICNISIPCVDPDGDSVTYRYEWYKDDAFQPELNANNVSSALTVKDQAWKCIVTPNDGIADGPSGEDSVTILNSPPTRPVVDVTPDSPDTTDELVCAIITPSYDPDGDVVTYRYDWYKNCVWQFTGETVLSLLTSKGETWKCVVTPNDGTEDGASGKDLVTVSYETTVYVDPQESAVKLGQAFKVNVSIADVRGLQGFDFCLSYDTTVLECLQVQEGPFMASFGPTIAEVEIEQQNESQGRVWMVVVTYGNTSANGRGTLATITFNATALGEGSLDLHSIQPYNPDAVKLSTCDPKAISNRAVDGHFKVTSDPYNLAHADLNDDGTANLINLATMTIAYGTQRRRLARGYVSTSTSRFLFSFSPHTRLPRY